jgi:hypothetical protein
MENISWKLLILAHPGLTQPLWFSSLVSDFISLCAYKQALFGVKIPAKVGKSDKNHSSCVSPLIYLEYQF